MVPHLVTSTPGPILDLERRLLDATPDIERWFRLQWQDHTPPFYASTDLRNAGFKLAPVDLNLYPGGFNNLSDEMLPLAVQAAQGAIDRMCCDARGVLLIPERHTRNTFYLHNVARLVNILRQTGLNVRLGSLSDDVKSPTRIELPALDGHAPTHLMLEPLVRTQRRLGLEGFDPCAILLNNDLSAGVPDILKNLHEQIILPPLHAGWIVRRKSIHARAYDRVINEFAPVIGVDPWVLNPYHARCGEIDFQARTGEDCLATNVSTLLDKIRAKYKEHGIKEQPFVIVKADAGTYGMGVMSVKSPDDVRDLNRKTRNKMSVVKEGLQVSEVILQEGVHTIERVNEAVAEPVVYMVDRYVVGGFYRVHAERGIDENLNAPGMQFVPLPFGSGCNTPDCDQAPGAAVENRFYMYGVVARLALVAASIELEMTDPDRADARASTPTGAPLPAL